MDREQIPEPTFTVRLGRAMLWVLRMTLVVAIGIALGVGAYLGGMYVYRQYWEPVPVHAIRLDILEGQQKQAVERLTLQRDELQGRIQELELQGDAHVQALDALRERMSAIETPQASERARLDAAYGELAQLQEALAQAEPTRAAIQAALDALQAADAAGQDDRETLRAELEAQQAALAELERVLGAAQDELLAAEARMDALAEQVDGHSLDLAAVGEALSGPTSPTALLHELQRVKAMQWLTRARLVLVQNNLGLAQVDLLAARRVLVALQADLPTDRAAQVAQVVDRLDAALGLLPAAPVAAADELEGAWQLLVADLSPAPAAAPSPTPSAAEAAGPEATPEVSPTAAAESEATPTPTPEPEATPTATPESEATPTPTPEPEASPTATPTPQS